MKPIVKHLLWFIPLILLFFGCPKPPVEVDLAWSSTAPAILPGVVDTMEIEDLGIADTVYVLRGNTLQSVSKQIRNFSANGLPAGSACKVRVVIEQYAFQAVLTGSIGYVPTGNTVVDTLLPGPSPVAARDSALFTANLNQVLPCGLYKLTMKIDSTGRNFTDVNLTNNLYEDFIFAPSDLFFNVQVATPDPAQITESAPPPITHTFNVTAGSPTVTGALYATLKVQATHGSTATSAPAPPVRLTPLPAAINVTVAPSAPPVDVVEDMLLKVTLFSDDGCILRQQTARVRILHDI